MARHIVYYTTCKKLETVPKKPVNRLAERRNLPTEKKARVIQPLNVNITLRTPKFVLKVIIQSICVEPNHFLITSSCLLVAV